MKYSYVDSIFLAGYFNIITEIWKRNETKRWDRIRQWKEWTGATKKNLVSVNFFFKASKRDRDRKYKNSHQLSFFVVVWNGQTPVSGGLAIKSERWTGLLWINRVLAKPKIQIKKFAKEKINLGFCFNLSARHQQVRVAQT